jgi:hypothetical protein
MLKKVAFVLALMVFVSFALALESGPSNTVGFTKVTCPVGYTPFGLAFKFWNVVTGVPQYGTVSTKPSSIVGQQLTPGTYNTGDRIYRQGGDWCFRQAASPYWSGALETNGTMVEGRAYFVRNRQAASQNMVLAGQVDTSAFGPIAIAANIYTPLSFRDARIRPVSQINLITSGFQGGTYNTSDRLYEQGGSWCWYNTGTSTWTGMANVTPAKAYFVRERHGATWNYNYGPGAVSRPPDRPGDDSIDKISRPPNRPSGAAR